MTFARVHVRLATGRALVATAFAVASHAGAQAAPSTDIHLLPVTLHNGVMSVGAPINITARPGYDNQPSFTPDGRSVLFTSVRKDGQSDIYRYDIAKRRTVRLTRTPESEYSATVTPDGRRMSVIRVEGDSTQRLWSFALDGRDPRLEITDVKPVGYHAWADDSTLALFVLGAPATLQVVSGGGRARTVLGGIGRSLHRIPGGQAISFVHKVSDVEWWIKRLDPGTDSVTPLVRTLPGSEDHAWMPDGSVLMARANTLYRWTPPSMPMNGAADWQIIATFDAPALGRISRLAVSPTGAWLAVVAAEAAR